MSINRRGLAVARDPAVIWSGYLRDGTPHPEAFPYATTWQMRRVRLENLCHMDHASASRWHQALDTAREMEQRNDFRNGESK